MLLMHEHVYTTSCSRSGLQTVCALLTVVVIQSLVSFLMTGAIAATVRTLGHCFYYEFQGVSSQDRITERFWGDEQFGAFCRHRSLEIKAFCCYEAANF